MQKFLRVFVPIGSMYVCMLYLPTFTIMYHKNQPFMYRYIPVAWILWLGIAKTFQLRWLQLAVSYPMENGEIESFDSWWNLDVQSDTLSSRFSGAHVWYVFFGLTPWWWFCKNCWHSHCFIVLNPLEDVVILGKFTALVETTNPKNQRLDPKMDPGEWTCFFAGVDWSKWSASVDWKIGCFGKYS